MKPTDETIATWRCDSCGERSLRRVRQPHEHEISHDGRAPVTIRIPDLEVIACTNPGCPNPASSVQLDDAALRRIGDETCRQLGLLTPAEIRAGREKLGLTQQQLQELLGLGGNSLSRWEKGRVYQSRSMDTLLRLVLEVPDVLIRLRQRPVSGQIDNRPAPTAG